MIVRETKRFSEIEVGDIFAWGGNICEKVSAQRLVIRASHRWAPGEGRSVHRDYAGTKLYHNPKHYVYASDVHAFLPYIRGKSGSAI